MNYKKPVLLPILTWIHSLLLFAFIYPLAASMLSLHKMDFARMSACGLLLVIPIVCSSLLLERMHHMLVYLLCGFGISAVSAYIAAMTTGAQTLAGSVTFWMTFCGGMLVFIVHTVGKVRYGNMKRDFLAVHGDENSFTLPGPEVDSFLTEPSYYHLAWFSIWYVVGMVLHFTMCLYVMFAMVFIDVFVIVGYHYCDALHQYVCQNRKVANLPLTTMRNIHRIIGILGALLLTLALLPSVLFGHEFDIQLKPMEPIDSTEIVQPANTEAMEGGNGNPFQDLDAGSIFEPPAWLLTLCKISGYVILVGIVVFILAQIIRSMRRHGQDFAVEQEDEITFLKPAENEHKESIFTRLRTGHRLSTNQQIRRRYRNTIKKTTKGLPNNWATPSELEQAASLPDNESTAHLHDCYEKARYSKDGCSNEELRSLR